MPPLHRFVTPRARAASEAMTPEPNAPLDGSALPSSPPRPRLRLRKRAATNLNAPTQHFLESVAAADVPIPSIEEPQVVDQDMLDTEHPAISAFYPIDLLPSAIQETRGRAFSPPKTPAPGAAPVLTRQFPSWGIDSPLSSRDSSPDSSRPSTARSSQTSASLFTQYSAHSSDLSQCVSPDVEHADKFGEFLSVDDALKGPPPAVKKSRRAPWTRQMSNHVWSTYVTYLQDPKVTPFHIGKSGIPPHGVCLRVARESRRSWRRSQQKPGMRPATSAATSSSSWPHSCAATRAHLRELCKANASSNARGQRFLSNSPAPHSRAAQRFRGRRSLPVRSPPGVFSSSDMAISLTLSTAESMQPNGPLAQLTSSLPGPNRDDITPTPSQPVQAFHSQLGSISSEPDRARLGSPFMANSYGPSSTHALDDPFGMPLDAPRQSQTSERRLASPARLTQSKPGSQKRRPAFMETRNRKRPSLGSDFWVKPAESSMDNVQAAEAAPEFSSTTSSQRDALFVPRANIQELFEASRPAAPAAQLFDDAAPPRLGSPFAAKSSSHSVPNRFSSPSRLHLSSAIRKPFATVQQQSSDSGRSSSSSTRSSLQTRLAYIDQRLKDFRRRTREKRSKSPQ